MYPTFEEIQKLHKKYSPSDELFDLVFTHCKIVQEIALQIIQTKHITLNEQLATAGALLHDIGSYSFIQERRETGSSKYYQHAVKSAQILRDENMPDELCALVEHHLGVGLTKEDIIKQNLDLPQKDFLPLNIEERLVLYADKFHSKKPQFNSFVSYKTYISQFGEDGVKRFEMLAKEFGSPDLEALSNKYNHPIK